MSLRVRINGDEHELERSLSVRELLERLSIDPRIVAVERNAKLVPRAEFDETRIDAGDVLEVVTFVGGG
jgi:sulfur carrier protein